MTPRKQIYIGVGLCVSAVVMVIVAVALTASTFSKTLFPDIPGEAVYVIDAPETVNIAAGEYQTWVPSDSVEGRTLAERRQNARVDFFDGRNDPLSVELIDPFGYLTDYWTYGIVTVPEDGDYLVTAGLRREVILTEPIDRFLESDSFITGITFGMTGVMAGLAGIGVTIAGLIGHNKRRRREAPPTDLRTLR